MINFSRYIIPLITIIVIIYGIVKKVNIYDEFLVGVKEGLEMALTIFPSMFAIIVAVTVFTKSNILVDLGNIVRIDIFPKEIIPIALLRPISSSSSLMLLNDIFRVYGPDSLIGMMTAVIIGSTDTTIYIIGMYYSSIKVKKIRYSLLLGLLADVTCVVISILIVKIL